MDAFVGGVVDQDSAQCDFVEDCEHGRGRICEEICQDGLDVGQVNIRDFQRLGIVCRNIFQLERRGIIGMDTLSPRLRIRSP